MPLKLNIRLSLLMFLQFFIWGSWFVTLGTYLLQTLEFSGREVGLVYGALAIAATISPFALGIVADRIWPSERILGFLHLIGGVVIFSASFVQDFFPFYSLMLLYTFCYLPTFSLANSLCFHHLENTSRDFPRVRVWGTVSWILIGLLISYWQIEDQATPLRISAFASAVTGFYCFSLPHTPPLGKGKKEKRPPLIGPEIRQLLTEKSILILLLCIGLIRIPASYYYSFVNPFMNEIGITHAAGKMSLGQMTEILMIVILPIILLRIKLKYIIFTGLFLWGSRYLFFAFGSLQNEWLIMIGIAMHGAAYTLATLSTQIYLDRRVPPELRASAQGFFTLLTQGAGALLGSYIAGETVSQFTRADATHDWATIWLIPAAVGIVTAMIFMIFFKSSDSGASESLVKKV